MKFEEILLEAVSDLFSKKESKVIMTQGEWNEIDESNKSEEIKKKIKYVRGLSDECREYAMNNHSQWINDVGSGKVKELSVHPDLIKKAKDAGIEVGFSMGVDKDGYYIHTHRARSKSKQKPDAFTQKEMKSVNSTG